jgi:SAM-dependent methyltransferase
MSIERKKTAVFLSHYSIGKSSPVICLLEILSDFYIVDVHAYKVSHLHAGVLRKINNVFTYDHNRHDVFDLAEITTVRYDHYIACDANGFVLCKTLFPSSRPIYYSLELYFRDNYYNLHYPERVMERERKEIHHIKGLIIQSEERESLFRKEYQLSAAVPAFHLPITYMQSSCREKSDFLRQKFRIPDYRKIALHLGGIQDHHCLLELAAVFHHVKNWALVLHGSAYGDYKGKLESFIRDYGISNVHISEEFLDNIEDLDILLNSSDVGIAWYKNVSPNFTTAGKSSGKISAYLRFGLPVLANRYRSTIEAIEDRGCGICVNAFEEIPNALINIAASYDYFSRNASNEYDSAYCAENYRGTLLDFIERKPLHTRKDRDADNTFLNPSLSADTMDIFWIRKSILRELTEYLVNCRGVLLDVGCGEMPYKSMVLNQPAITRYLGLDIENPNYQAKLKPDIYWDGIRIPLPDESVDCAVATEIFEHVPDLEATLREIRRVLKPGGSIFFTVPFLWPLHDVPQDECRYTPFSLKRTLLQSGYCDIDIKAHGGWDASLAQMIGLWVKRRPMDSSRRDEFMQLLYPFYKRLVTEADTSTPLSYENMSTESVMITGLYGTAEKPYPSAGKAGIAP